MRFEFEKFLIKKSSMWSTGNFKIYNSDNDLVFLVKSPIWQFKKSMELLSKDEELIYTIEQKKSWPAKFMIMSDGLVIASFERQSPFQGKQIDVILTDLEDIAIKPNIWGNSFSFMSNEEEIAMLSYDMWSMGEFGLAMKNHYPSELILAIVTAIAYLKESGQV